VLFTVVIIVTTNVWLQTRVVRLQHHISELDSEDGNEYLNDPEVPFLINVVSPDGDVSNSNNAFGTALFDCN